MDTLDKYLAGKTPAFSDEPWYSKDGDCVFVNFKNTESYASRVDGLLTVHKDIETDEIVGCQVKSIKYLLKDVDMLELFIRKNNPFRVLIHASFFATKNDSTAIPEREVLYDDVCARVGNRKIAPIEELAIAN